MAELSAEYNYTYDFYNDGVTQSMMGDWLRMPQMAEAAYMYGLQPSDSRENTNIGSIIHKCLEHLQQLDHSPDLNEIDKELSKARRLYKIDEMAYWKTKAILNCYFAHYPDDFKTRKITGTEEAIRVKHDFTWLNGLVDTKFTYLQETWLSDTKCSGQFKLPEFLALGEHNLQPNVYMFATGVNNFEYNHIKIPTTRRDTRKKETPQEYYLRLVTKMLKDPKEYFLRLTFRKSKEDINYWVERQLDPILKTMRIWFDTRGQFPNYINVTALGGSWGLSPYSRLLLEGDITDFTVKQRPFMELPDYV